MSLMFFSGFEIGDFSEWMSITGPDPGPQPTVQSSIKKTGTYAARVNTAGASCKFQTEPLSYKRLSFNFYVASFPLEEDGWVHIVNRGGSTIRVGCKINSDGQIFLALASHDDEMDYWNSGFHLLEGQWYRICLCTCWDPVSETGKDRLYVDGVLVCSDDDSYSTYIGYMLGVSTLPYGTCDIYFDDIVYDDNESLEDIGDIRVLRAGVIGAGEYAEFDSYAGSAVHYENVDELPYSDDDYNWNSATSVVREGYTLENCSTIGLIADNIIKAVKTLCRMKAAKRATDCSILRRDNGINYEEPVILQTSFDWFSKIDETMPNGGGDWTQDRFDNLEVGIFSDGEKDDPYISCALVMIAFGFVSGLVAAQSGLTGTGTVIENGEPPPKTVTEKRKIQK